jgi:dimeric dUTPase (all-alpha-NTP-PPase superfamily)
MHLNLSELVQYQDELDQRIHTLHQQTRESTRSKRILALMVEIAELANETRSFKYWSVRGANERSILLEEFVDAVHFTISLGLDLGQDSCISEVKSETEDLSQLFILWLKACGEFEAHFDVQHYENVLSYLPRVAHSLGFSEAEILDVYRFKNQKNHQRQNEAY